MADKETVEFSLTTDLQAVLPKAIEFNYAEIKGFLQNKLDVYKGLVVTEADIPSAKTIRANINKLSKGISDYRISVKKEYLAPFEQFETQAKELCEMCNTVSDNIGRQINAFDEERRIKKLAALHEYYNGIAGEMEKFLPYDRIAKKEWGNASYNIDNAKAEISLMLDRARGDVDAIKSMDSEFTPILLMMYAENNNLSECLRKATEMEKAKFEHEKELAEAKPISKEETAPAEQKTEQTNTQASVSENEPLYKVTLEFVVTKAQATKMNEFFKANGIKCKKVTN